MKEREKAHFFFLENQKKKKNLKVPEMIAMISDILAAGHAYVAPLSGDVMFSVEGIEGYGRLSGRTTADNRAGERVAVDGNKRNPADFVLWKSAKPGEPAWESPWGPGRPGWHIECSAMAR
jgi:cysteinyl-tRNA synthetase